MSRLLRNTKLGEAYMSDRRYLRICYIRNWGIFQPAETGSPKDSIIEDY